MTSELLENSAAAKQVVHSLATVQIPVRARGVKPNGRLLIPQDSDNPRLEKLRTLCAELLLRRDAGDETGVFALASPGPGEGRTQLAAELAISLARLGRSTLLVDADLRRPQMHLLFGADNSPGLAQALERNIPPHLHAVENVPQLFLLTAGATPHNPMELLSQPRFAAMMEEWRQTFDFVVIDTAPSIFYADALAVASLAGKVLTVNRAHYTLSKDTKDMLRRLHSARSEVVGAIISHF